MNSTHKIGICQNLKMWNHEGSWTEQFINYCQTNKLTYEIIDPYTNDTLAAMKNCDIVLWHIQNYLWADLLQARNILNAAEQLGITVFPNQKTNWHFDDKIAEMYAFKAVDAPIPQSWVFYSIESTCKFLSQAQYPLVAKLRNGSGASNVKLLKSEAQARRYANRMFGRGLDPSPSLMYKAYSKAQSSHNWKTFIQRVKKLPQFLYTLRNAKMMPIEKGYCYFQEFIENDGYDLKIVVVGDKLSYCSRSTRKADFRASGGGTIYYDNNLITKDIIDSAFSTADSLNLQCVGFDYVVDKKTQKGYIIEMCFGFDAASVINANGYFTRDGNWISTPINIPHEIIKQLITEQKKR